MVSCVSWHRLCLLFAMLRGRERANLLNMLGSVWKKIEAGQP